LKDLELFVPDTTVYEKREREDEREDKREDEREAERKERERRKGGQGGGGRKRESLCVSAR